MNKKPSTQNLVCSNVLPFAMLVANIVMGTVYLNDCPRQPYIPIYLIVLGALGMVPVFSSCCCMPGTPGSTSSLKVLCNIWSGLVSLFLLCWFICGNVWIYSIYQPSYNKNISNYNLPESNYNKNMSNYNQNMSNYNLSQPNYSHTLINNQYCNRTLYLFAFWSNNLTYLILLGLCVVLCCCCCCGFAISACKGHGKAESVPMGDKGSPEGDIL